MPKAVEVVAALIWRGDRFLACVRFREEEHVFHQFAHAFSLGFDIFHPLLLRPDGRVRILQQDVRIGEHDGERRLNLVRSIGHELFLLHPCLLHRADGNP